MTLAAIKVITFLRQHRRIAGKCGRIARHIHNTFTIRCGKANKAYAASAPQHKHRCAADQAAFYPIAPRCNRAWVHFKQIGRLKSTHWFHSYMKQALSRVCRTNSPPLKAGHLGAFLVHRQLPQKISSALSDGLPHQRPRSGVHAGNKRQARLYINAQPWRRHHTLFVSHLRQRFHMLRCTSRRMYQNSHTSECRRYRKAAGTAAASASSNCFYGTLSSSHWRQEPSTTNEERFARHSSHTAAFIIHSAHLCHCK